MSKVDAQRRLAAILVADVVGYSRMMGRDEADTLRSLKAARREVVDPALRAFRGRVVKTTGDGLLVEFPSAVEAVRCAAHVQHAMATRNKDVPDDRRIVFRVGVHQGDIIGDGEDIFGDDVNVAARLEALSDPGGVCISGRVHEDLVGRLDLPFEDRGEQHMKNIAQPVRAYGLSRDTVAALVLPPLMATAQQVAPSGKPPSNTFSKRGIWIGAAVVAILASLGAAWVGVAKFGVKGDADVDITRGPGIAVLAFDNLSGDKALDAFADGLSEQLIADLSGFGVYDVLARNTTFVYKGKAVDVPEIGRKLGAQYLVEGSVRRVGDRLAVTAQLIETRTGAHVWAQTFEDSAASTSTGEIQDSVAQRISAAVGDTSTGLIASNDLARNRLKSAQALSPFECVVQALWTFGPGVARTRDCLEATLKRAPNYAPAWSSLAQVLVSQRWWGYALPPAEAQDIDRRAYLANRAVEAGLRAVALAPDKAYAHFALAYAYHGACQRDRLRVEADRVIAMNPGDSYAQGMLGNFLAYEGDWDYGRLVAERAIALAGPSAQNFWHWAAAKGYYHKGDYENAYKTFLVGYTGGWWLDVLHIVYTLPYLDRTEEAKARIPELLKLMPDMSVRLANQYHRMWCFDDDYIAKMDFALRKAGLRETAEAPQPIAVTAKP